MRLETRILNPDDAPAATGLLTHLNPGISPAILQERYETILRDHSHYYPFGVFADGRLVGIASAWIATKIWCGRYLELDNIVVDPACRGSGAGTALITALEALAREKECSVLVIDSYASNHASHRLYHRLGFEIWSFHFIKPLKDFAH